MELLCWALLKQLYLSPNLAGSRIAARCAQDALALTPGCPQAKWMHRALLVCSVCSHSAYTLLEQPLKLRGAETAPLPFPPHHQPQAGFRRPRRLSRAGCRRRQRCPPAGWEPGDAELHTPEEGLATSGALLGARQGRERRPSPGEAAGGQRAPRAPRTQRGSQRTSRGRSAVESEEAPTGARILGGSDLPGLTPPVSHPRQRRDPPEAALALLSPAAHRRGPGGEPAPGPAAAPTPPSRAPAWQEKERRDGNRRPYQQEGVRPASLLSLWEAKTFLLWQQPRSRTGYPHTDTARRTRPTPALSTWPPGGRRRAGRRALPRPGGRGRGARNRRRLPRREGSVGSSCGLIRPAGFMCQGKTARAANDVVLNHLHFK